MLPSVIGGPALWSVAHADEDTASADRKAAGSRYGLNREASAWSAWAVARGSSAGRWSGHAIDSDAAFVVAKDHVHDPVQGVSMAQCARIIGPTALARSTSEVM
jgi:hypothetical protein